MARRIGCPGCKSVLKVDERHAGKSIACPKCATKIRVPDAPADDAVDAAEHQAKPSQEPRAPWERSGSKEPAFSSSGRKRPARQSEPEDVWDQPLDDDDDEDDVVDEMPRARSNSPRRPAKTSRPSSGIPAWIPNAIGIGVCAVLFAFAWMIYQQSRAAVPLETIKEPETHAERQMRERREGIAEPADPAPSAPAIAGASNAPVAATGGAPSIVPDQKALIASGSVNAATAKSIDMSKLSPKTEPTRSKSIMGQLDVTPDKEKPAVAPGADMPLEELIEYVGDCVVMIRVKDKSGKDVGLGSGFVIDSSGLVATCHHVVKGAKKVVIRFRNGFESDASGFRQMNPGGDLAILQMAVKLPKLRALPLAGDTPMRPGQEVIAIGHPSGLSFTPTRGIISGIHKTNELPAGPRQFLKNAPKDQQWIQTDAVISPGNSGGPLFNRKGEVIGVNSWISQQTRFAFAVHVQHLKEMQQQLYAELKPISTSAGGASAAAEIDPEVQGVVTEFRRSAEEFMVDYGKAREKAMEGDPSEMKTLLKRNPAKPFALKLIQIAAAKKKTPVALQALLASCEALAFSDPENSDDLMQRTTKQLLEDHVAAEELGDMALRMQELEHLSIRSFLQSLMDKSPHKDVKAYAGISLVVHLDNRLSEMENEATAKKLSKDILAVLKRVEAEFGDVSYEDSTLAQFVKPMIFEKENLEVGCKVPEIVGADLDGAEFKFSDLTGKTTLLVFWGDWHRGCRSYYPYLRKLVKNLEGKPFELVGVNSDVPSRAEKVKREKETNWRSWSDGPDGPIAKQWNVSSYPRMFIIDHKGIIRHKGIFTPDFLESAVGQLVAETKGGASTGKAAARNKKTGASGGKRGK